jgi:hypothetical protein
MTFQSATNRVLDSLFTQFGQDALLTPNGGEALLIRVIHRQADVVMDIGRGVVQSDSSVFLVRTSDRFTPKSGDLLEVGSKTYQLQGPPTHEQQGLIWKMEAYPHAP